MTLHDAAQAAISGFPDYRITPEGETWSLRLGKSPHKLTPHPDSHGYMRVQISRPDGSRTGRAVHRLVAAAFLPPCPPDCDQLRHLNGDKRDNRASNLAWGTAKDNADDRERHGHTAKGERNGQAKLTTGQIITIRELYANGETTDLLARAFQVDVSRIRGIVRGSYYRTADLPNPFQRDIDHWNRTGKCLRHFALDTPPLFCEQCGKSWNQVMDGRMGRRLRRAALRTLDGGDA